MTRAPGVRTWLDDAGGLLAHEYGLAGALSMLPGENLNALVEAPAGARFVLKLASDDRPRDVLEFEHAIVEHLVQAGVGLGLPRVMKTRSGSIEARWAPPTGPALRGRLLEFVAGTPWCEAGDPPRGQFRDLGQVLATVDRALAGFTHHAARRTHRWDLARADQHRHNIKLIATAERRRLAEGMFHQWAAGALPRLPELPRSAIYADANDENVLVRNGRVTGLLDFGDALENPTVCELAIGAVYAMLDRPDPLADAAAVVAGYHAVRPLEQAEIDVLFPLVCGRLAASVTVAAERRQIDASNTNWFVTEDRAWRLIEKLSQIDPEDATRQLAKDLGGHFSQNRGKRPQRSSLLGARHAHVGSALSVAYRQPLAIVRGAGQYLFDDGGRPFLDLVNNVCHVGHCHPRVVAAGQIQMARLNTNTRYLYDGLPEYARRLAATLPDPLDVCFLVNSGSEANELALRLARAHTRRHDVLVVDGAYHGNTTTLIAMSPYKFKGKGGTGTTEPWVHVAPVPDGYRGVHKGTGRAAGEAYGDSVGRAIEAARAPIAAFVAESLMSCAGQILPPAGYLERAFAHARGAGALAIVDEVQTGFGRAGSHFWGFETQGVVPDIVVMGKPIGNGHPMGAVVTTREIAASFDNGMEFFSTFGGNPVSCAIGLAVLDVIEHEGLQARAAASGRRLMDGLRDLMLRHAIIGDVRGMGLFIGVELVRDRGTMGPAAEEAADLINRVKDRGILLSTDGPLHNVLKIKPPMVLTEQDVDMVVRVLDDELSRTGDQ
jgi:4-aminobutyrate aminotransferase-like enzyme/Ser/Thr protein kinase RdoA (MazF antagonist)